MLEATYLSKESIPKGLSDAGQKAAELIVAVTAKHHCTYTGGCKTFYTPQEWKARKEEYGTNSELIVVYDGGDLYDLFNEAYGMYDNNEALYAINGALEDANMYIEPCTQWYGAVYFIN